MVGGAESMKRTPMEITAHIVKEFGNSTYNPRVHAELGHDEFLEQLRYALSTSPPPLTSEERRRLSWEGETS